MWGPRRSSGGRVSHGGCMWGICGVAGGSPGSGMDRDRIGPCGPLYGPARPPDIVRVRVRVRVRRGGSLIFIENPGIFIFYYSAVFGYPPPINSINRGADGPLKNFISKLIVVWYS